MMCSALTLVIVSIIPAAAKDFDVLKGLEGAPPPSQMMSLYLNRLTDEAFARRISEREALETPEQIAAYQERTRQFFIDQLGGLPERTPLNPQVVDTVDGEGYRIEKIIYESRPKFYVSAALFLPEADPPYPGVLVPCGHSANGKGSEAYQWVCMLLARHGMAALIYDPIEQGERAQVLTPGGKPQVSSTIGHTMTGQGCILLGTNTAAYRIWDGMRGIDYLMSRPDIDKDRIGCTGNSGGGTLTSYLMALDTRIQCAAPSCYLTNFPRLFEEAGPQDAEQNIHGQIAFGMDHADYIMMRAPKPTLMCAATQDFFDIRGTWESFREAKRLYTKLGFAERVSLVEAPEKHGFTELLREGAVGWMQRWLLGVDEAVDENQPPALTDEEIQVTPKGQVLLLEGARSVYDINAGQAEALKGQREAFLKDTPRGKVIEKVEELNGWPLSNSLDDLKPASQQTGTLQREGYTIEKYAVTIADGFHVPVLVFRPSTVSAVHVYAEGQGKAACTAPGGPVEKLVQAGHLVVAPDLPGLGETMSEGIGGAWLERFGPNWKDFFRAYLLGRSYVGIRAEAILHCLAFAQALPGAEGLPVHLTGTGVAAVPALHAAAFRSDAFASIHLDGMVTSWHDVALNPQATGQLANTVHGALRYYDLPDLAALLGPEKVEITNSVKP